MGCWGSNPCWLCLKQALYLLLRPKRLQNLTKSQCWRKSACSAFVSSWFISQYRIWCTMYHQGLDVKIFVCMFFAVEFKVSKTWGLPKSRITGECIKQINRDWRSVFAQCQLGLNLNPWVSQEWYLSTEDMASPDH